MNRRKLLFLVTTLLTLSVSSIGISLLRKSITIPGSGVIIYPTSPTGEYGVCFHAYGWDAEYNNDSKNIILELSKSGNFWIRPDWLNIPEFVEFKDDMTQMGVKVLAILDYELFDYGDFTLVEWEQEVTTAVTMAPDMPAWEIWNEPNLPQFQMGYMDGTPERYVDILQVAYEAIKSENPNALVVGPGLFTGWGPVNLDWLQSIIDLGALDYLDVVSIHLYYYDVTQNQAILNQAKSMVGTKPIWVTEIGAESAYGEDAQNTYLQENFDPQTGLTADKLFWYELADKTGEGSTFGLARADYTYKPAYYSFRALLG